MTMNHLPPQAYTTETVSKAYAWLLNQPESIKDMAKSVEVLVGLYLKAQRHGDDALMRPSAQNFRSELKNIKNMMGNFENQAHLPPPSPPTDQSPKANEAPPTVDQPRPTPLAPPKEPTQRTGAVQPLSQVLDKKSWMMAQEIKMAFNLSDENEAVRLLISLGFQKANKLFDK